MVKAYNSDMDRSGMFGFFSVYRETRGTAMEYTTVVLKRSVGGFAIAVNLYLVPGKDISPPFNACWMMMLFGRAFHTNHCIDALL